MLEMKELKRPPTGGVGKAVNLLGVKQVDKTTLKTRAFQEACIYSVVEELAEHLAQLSYSVAFFELSFVPLVQLRSFCKSTNIDRFRREIKALIQQVEANIEFTNAKRMVIDFSPNDPAIESFLKAEKESGSSPLSRFASSLRLRAQQRSDSMVESSVFVGKKLLCLAANYLKLTTRKTRKKAKEKETRKKEPLCLAHPGCLKRSPRLKKSPSPQRNTTTRKKMWPSTRIS
ncbi:nucleolar complex protein 2-like protein isoform X2 [Iris pallida]|uniref:Nucleolar complex protein 2-like protein isoform X2 n=1 Tax=Iris pallida TaxID=29817 RepID=A0AAX6EP23_IRIPA|nr:nucleolar complex protein 2-like protein isoform X2 [Iris pallida]